MKIPNGQPLTPTPNVSLARIVSEDSQRGAVLGDWHAKSSKDS